MSGPEKNESTEFRWLDPLAIGLFVATFVIYYFSSQGEGNPYNYHVLLSQAMLNGSFNLGQNYTWLELVEREGKYYTVFPPGPAVLLMPFVYFFGLEFYQPLLSIFAGAVSVWLSFFVLLKLFESRRVALWGALLLGFGTIQWYHAQVGSGWYVGQIVAIMFLWASLATLLYRKSFFLGGLFLGAAYISRLPTSMAVVFIGLFFLASFIRVQDRRPVFNFKNILLFTAGVSPSLLLNFYYNYSRFGTFSDIAYDLLPIHNEPWYQHGLFSIKYVPVHLKEMFLGFPIFQSEYPYVIPSLFAMAIWLVMPGLLLIVAAPLKSRLTWCAAAAVLASAVPGLIHGGNGFTQFGYRHTLDYLPFLVILASAGIKRTPAWIYQPLILLSIAVNLWGVIMISFLKIWTMRHNILFYD